MMNLRLLCLLLFINVVAWGQKVEFTYDSAGNRTSRQIITLTLKSASMPDSVLSREVISGKDFAIYPNPTEGLLNLRITGLDGNEPVTLQISDLKGRVLISEKESSSFRTIDLTMYPSGMYILIAMIGNDKREWKIIKK